MNYNTEEDTMMLPDPDGNLENVYKCRLEDRSDYGNIERRAN